MNPMKFVMMVVAALSVGVALAYLGGGDVARLSAQLASMEERVESLEFMAHAQRQLVLGPYHPEAMDADAIEGGDGQTAYMGMKQ